MATTAATPARQAKAQAKAQARSEATFPRRRVEATYFLMLLPVVLLFTLFITVPALVGVFYSFTNYQGYGNWKFIGLTNYLALFSDPRILSSYGFTLWFSLVTVIVVNVVALVLALGLNAKIKLKTTLRGVFFIPMVISGIVIAYVFNFLFSTSLPALATSLGITPLQNSILTDSRFAWTAIVVVAAWQAVPGAVIIYLAGLLAIPSDVYEAAAIDGAGAWRQFRSITFPLVAGYVVINTILGIKGFLNAYDVIVGLTNGGPGTSTFSVAMTIFTGFTSGDYAYQMANAVVFFVVTVLISLVQLQLIRRRGVSL
jgi:raffinose/stachyose/melibiose transport system permease protein